MAKFQHGLDLIPFLQVMQRVPIELTESSRIEHMPLNPSTEPLSYTFTVYSQFIHNSKQRPSVDH